MIRLERHPLVRRDLREMVRHIIDVSGERRAAEARLDEVDALLAAIVANPRSGAHLSGNLAGWRVRPGGKGRTLTVVFRLIEEKECIQIPLIAFGGQNWMANVGGRGTFFRDE